jgi:Carboxypeptidase regulatory-like domain
MYAQRPCTRLIVHTLVVSVWMVLIPTAALAQSSITGVVKDSSGAVLPGVTVEAASDVLIEKVRTAVSDGTGQYRIVDLRAGTYTVTFTLSGFNTFKREELELPTDFVATVNAGNPTGNWLNPLGVMTARTVKLTAQWDF